MRRVVFTLSLYYLPSFCDRTIEENSLKTTVRITADDSASSTVARDGIEKCKLVMRVQKWDTSSGRVV